MNHLKKIASLLPEYDLEALLITSGPNEFYAVGFRGEGYVLVTPEKCYYSTDSRYIEAAQQLVAGTNCELHMISGTGSHRDWAAEVCAKLGLVKIGFEESSMSVADFAALKRFFPSNTQFIPASSLLTRLRGSKDEEELAVMRKAQAITDRAFQAILQDIKPGVPECEIAAKLTYYMMSFGAQKNSFDPIVASGANGSMPHAIPTDKPIQKGEFVTMDFGCIWGGYCSDMTRTVAVGEPTEEMRNIYNTVLEAQLSSIALIKAGVPGIDIHQNAEKVLAQHGYAGRMGHGFGHSLGIEIHEVPGFRPANPNPMPAGAVVSAEPGIYLPGFCGVRIEDVVVVREGGCEILTKSPKELIVL